MEDLVAVRDPVAVEPALVLLDPLGRCLSAVKCRPSLYQRSPPSTERRWCYTCGPRSRQSSSTAP